MEFEDHDEQLLVSVVPDQTVCMSVRPLTGNPRRLTQLVALKLLGFVGGAMDGPVHRSGQDDSLKPVVPALDRVSQLRYIVPMKTSTIPSVRVEPEFRAEVESVLAEGESLTAFVEASVRASVERRRVQAEFIARGLRSRDEAKRTGEYVEADDVVASLQRRLDAARARLSQPPKAGE